MKATTRRALLAVAGAGLLVATLVGGVGGAEAPNQQFRLYGPAGDAVDPHNPDNEVVIFDTTSGAPVFMFRPVHELVAELDNQIEFKYYMQDRNCGAGSPRVDLFLDINNDGRVDGVLEGHVQPDFACPNQNTWVYQDLTDDVPRWGSRGGLPGGPGNFYAPWDAVEATFAGATVLFGMLVEDSQAFKADNRGIAYYDLVTIGNKTYSDHSDSARCTRQYCSQAESSLAP